METPKPRVSALCSCHIRNEAIIFDSLVSLPPPPFLQLLCSPCFRPIVTLGPFDINRLCRVIKASLAGATYRLRFPFEIHECLCEIVMVYTSRLISDSISDERRIG